MTDSVRRAGAFVAVGALSLGAVALAGLPAPLWTLSVVGPYVAVAAGALYLVDRESALFDLLARPGDREEGRLYGLAGFALAAAGLGLLATRFGLAPAAFVASVFVLSVGALAQALVGTRRSDPFVTTAGFAAGGAAGGAAALSGAAALTGSPLGPPAVAFLAASGALLAALLRTVLFERDDPLVMVSVALLLWLFVELGVGAGSVRVGVGVAVTVLLGYVAYAVGIASLAGMLTGALLALLAIVLGGYGWFALLVTFFGVGGLAAKYRYDEKRARGIAEDDEGARGSGNVLANSAVALVAVVAFAASEHVGVDPALFRFAFAGSVAAAMSDTLSSEIGGLYDGSRLITTLEPVPPGTDGGVTWQGELAGLGGAGLVALIAAGFFGFGAVGAAIVVAGGLVGMTVDSLLGATLEGATLDNEGVNFFATLSAAVVAAGLVLAVGA